MVNYKFEKETFVIEDFQEAKPFCSFLPAVAGLDGKPLWAFYATVGQGMGGFGVTSKDTPITPFDSANLAYQNIPIKSFRTFVKVDGRVIQPFFDESKASRTMFVNKSHFSIREVNPDFQMDVTYSTVSHRPYPALIRKVSIKNLSGSAKRFSVVDGLPVFFPHGLSNVSYKEMVSLMSAYCEIERDAQSTFVKFKTSTSDASTVTVAKDGHGFRSFGDDGTSISSVYDPDMVFGNDLALLKAKRFETLDYRDFLTYHQQTENKLPCAFTTFERMFASGETFTFYTIYGYFSDSSSFFDISKGWTPKETEGMIEESEQLIARLLKVAECHTSSNIFDMYVAQSLLDNNLRGGFPTMLEDGNGGKPYYVYSRKHGDMERDYNAFNIPSMYYSSGAGNFRDVNQNRRTDLCFNPFVEDYNIHLFFSLIQMDGQNPLNVKPLKFVMGKAFDVSLLDAIEDKAVKAQATKLVNRGFEPSELYTLLKDNENGLSIKADDLFSRILNKSEEEIQANFGEGYWIDHWTYNVDLLENYRNVFPDKMEELLFRNDYPYFQSLVYVEPRSEKYSLLPDGKIRQYGAVDLRKFKEEGEKLGYDPKETRWMENRGGDRIEATLAEKIFNLSLIKFSTLDSYQMGVEMECEKPGWNDAMNGLPGLFASGMSETVELLRLVNFAISSFGEFANRDLSLLEEQYALYSSIQEGLDGLLTGKLDGFSYWDKATTAREKLRLDTHLSVSGITKSIKIKDAIKLLRKMKGVLEKGIRKAKEAGDGIIISYLVYDMDSYEETGYVNHLGYKTVKAKHFSLVKIPPFLEASARALKLGPDFMSHEDIKAIYDSDLRDKELGIYKTCASIDDAPFEIGRVHAFTKGWLERECDFLHMSYKYLLGLLKAGYYADFYKESEANMVYNMDPFVYGRSPIENSSFVVPTCNPDKTKWGRGFFARLTGANAEFLEMYMIMFAGENMFSYENGLLSFHLEPKLPAEAFDDNGRVSFVLFGKVMVTYHNPERINLYESGLYEIRYDIGKGRSYQIVASDAIDLRDGKIDKLDAYIVKKGGKA